jgi:hypothetical protein
MHQLSFVNIEIYLKIYFFRFSNFYILWLFYVSYIIKKKLCDRPCMLENLF